MSHDKKNCQILYDQVLDLQENFAIFFFEVFYISGFPKYLSCPWRFFQGGPDHTKSTQSPQTTSK